MISSDEIKKYTEKYSLGQKIFSISLIVLGILMITLTSTGITGNIIKSSQVSADSNLFGFSIGILLIAISTLVLIKKGKNE